MEKFRRSFNSSFPPVDELVPQSGAMVFLDEVVSADGGEIVCRTVVSEANRALSAGAGGEEVPLTVGIECMAQAAAALNRLQAEDLCGDPEVGYLLGSRLVECFSPGFVIGQKLLVRAEVDSSLGPTALICGQIEDENSGELLMKAVLHVHRLVETPSVGAGNE